MSPTTSPRDQLPEFCFNCKRRRNRCRCEVLDLKKQNDDVKPAMPREPSGPSGLLVIDMNPSPSMKPSPKATNEPFGDCLVIDDCCAERGKPVVHVTRQERRACRSEARTVCFNFVQTPIDALELEEYFDAFGKVDGLQIFDGGMNGLVTFHDKSVAQSVLTVSKHVVQPGKSMLVAPCYRTAFEDNAWVTGLPIDCRMGEAPGERRVESKLPETLRPALR